MGGPRNSGVSQPTVTEVSHSRQAHRAVTVVVIAGERAAHVGGARVAAVGDEHGRL